jgi:hypothetical protein
MSSPTLEWKKSHNGAAFLETEKRDLIFARGLLRKWSMAQSLGLPAT